MMGIQAVALWLLAFALIIHTIEEGWLPEYRSGQSDWRALVFNRPLFLENFPIFIFAVALAAIGWRVPLIAGVLPAVGLTHPLLDHVGLSWKARHFRPGSWTGIFLLFPLSIWVYGLGNRYNLFQSYEFFISGGIGLAISIWLFWIVDQEIQKG